jgi:hypothetical protein
METRRQNRPVSMTAAIGLLTPDMGLSVARSTKPCARDPPRRAARVQRCQQGLRAGVPRQTLQGKTSPHPRPQSGERRRSNVASPGSRTREASPSNS